MRCSAFHIGRSPGESNAQTESQPIHQIQQLPGSALRRVVQKGGAAMTEKEILALEDKRFGAMIARDLKALEAMLHGDLLYTHSSGVTDTKATWLQAMQSGKT